MGILFRAVGGYPVDRGPNASGVVEQMISVINQTDQVCVGFPPEGTRSKVEKYKSGYLRVAYATGVPVFLAVFDGSGKRVVLDRKMDLTGDLEADNTAIKTYVDSHWTGINPERQ